MMKSFLSLLSGLVVGCLVAASPGADATGTEPGVSSNPILPVIRLAITAPADGARFSLGEPILIEASAVSSLGGVYRLEFYDGMQRIGVSEILTLVAIPPGEPAYHELLWKDAPVGRHQLRVQAADSGIPVWSPPVTIDVGDVKPVARVEFSQPKEGSTFENPESIELVADATDPEGILDVVEFTANGEVIGASHFDFCPPCPSPPICPLGPCMLPPAGVTLTHRFLWERPAAGKYVLGARAVRPNGQAVESVPVAIAVVRAGKASLTWNSPDEGSLWNTPGVIPLQVTTVDPDGEIRRVEFFANEKRIGVSEILTRDVEIPGRPRTLPLNWTNPPAGTYALQAKAVSRAGGAVSSAVRKVIIVGDLSVPIVRVETIQGTAVEGRLRDDGTRDSLRFRIHRTGGLQRPVNVFFHFEGKALPGVDYQVPPGGGQLDPGQTFTDVVLEPLDDHLSEGSESVVMVIDPSPAMGPLEPYRIDPNRSKAKGMIEDDEPVFTFQAPEEGAVFRFGAPVPVRVMTRWAPDFVSHLEFLADGKKIGDSVVNFIQAPPPGTPVFHEFEWSGAPAGGHRITVQSILADGTVIESADARNIRIESQAVPPEVGLKVVDGVFSEGGADGQDRADVLLRRSGDTRQPLTVYLQWLGTATAGVDFGPAPTEVQIPAGKSEVHLVLSGYADDRVEGDETVELSIIHPPTLPGVILYRTSASSQVRLLLHDGSGIPTVPVVTVLTGRAYALEGDRFNRGEFVLNRTGDLSKDIAVQVAFAGTARRGVDFHVLLDPCDDCAATDQGLAGDVVLMPAGVSTRVLGILAIADSAADEAEPVLEDVQLQVLTPPIPAVVGARPPYIAGGPDRAMVQVVDRVNPNGAEVILISPTAGSVLPWGTPNELRAIAVDPEGSMRRLEFLANGRVIGVSEINTEEVDVPGKLRIHSFAWTVVLSGDAGRYELWVQGKTARGTAIRSATVPVTVGGMDPALPVVTVTRGKSPAGERGDLKSRTGGFVFQRKGGDSATALTVFADVAGTATAGQDYQWINGPDASGSTGLPWFGAFIPVTFPPGASEVEFNFIAATDERVEGDETVVLRLIDPPFDAMGFPGIPFPWLGYIIGTPDFAEVVIQDADLEGPRIVMNAPADGAAFRRGEVILLSATAIRPDAGVEFIEFLADGQVIARVEYCCDVCDCPAAPVRRPFVARFDWRSAPPGTHLLSARTVVGANHILESTPVTIVVGDAPQDSLVIVDPPDGAVFPVGHPLTIDTIGQLPGSLVSTVEFFANGTKIGETCFLCVVDAIFQPGTPLHNSIQWTPTVPGRYELTAVGQFGPDHRVKSRPVVIQVDGGAVRPRLTIVDPPDGAFVASGAAFTVSAIGVGREGGIADTVLLVDGKPVAESRLVFIRPPGADEEVRHEFLIRLEAGAHKLVVQDLMDPAVISKPVTIHAGKAEARITWISPQDGSVFDVGTPILLEVEAVDPDGLMTRVEFFDGDHFIGVSEFNCPTCRFAPGAVIPHQLEWRGAAVGRHVLKVQGIRADGVVVSSPSRRVNVRHKTQSDPFVTRVLPRAYAVGKAFTVSLIARPDPSVAAYVVEEMPPYTFSAPGSTDQAWPIWQVVSISHHGAFDPLTGKVKFGPFFDHEPRTLTYDLVAGFVADVTRFDGVGVADGTASSIGGDSELRGNSRHPADVQAADDSIQATELTAYAAAWKREKVWPGGPNPIPVEYVTRAAHLWKGGERYFYDPASGPPPFCWVSGRSPVPIDLQGSASAPLAGVALRSVNPQPDGTLRVTIRVTPAHGAGAFAVEESVPGAGTVSGISADGVWASGSRTVRWGPFYSGDAPVLSYVVSGVSMGTASSGVASFDGQNVSIHTDSGVDAPGGTPARLVGVDPLHDGSRQVSLEGGDPGQTGSYELQVSGDLRHWTRVGTFTPGLDAAASFARDATAAGAEVRFYRAVRLP